MTAQAGKDVKKTGAPDRSVPSVGQGDMSSIPKVELDLHGDAIDHWQDEPRPKPDEARDRRGR